MTSAPPNARSRAAIAAFVHRQLDSPLVGAHGDFEFAGKDHAALALFEAMSQVSEERIFASWESGNGETIWAWLQTGEMGMHGDLALADLEDLRAAIIALAEISGIWWADYEYCVPLADWIAEHGPAGLVCPGCGSACFSEAAKTAVSSEWCLGCGSYLLLDVDESGASRVQVLQTGGAVVAQYRAGFAAECEKSDGLKSEVEQLTHLLDAHREAAARLCCPVTGASGGIPCSSAGDSGDAPAKGCHYVVGGPYTSYTLPEVDADGELYRWKFDDDEGCWREAENLGARVLTEEDAIEAEEAHETAIELLTAERDALASRVQDLEHRTAPVLGGPPISWPTHERAWAVYASKYGKQQSAERIAQRGGFSVGELDQMLPTWRAMEASSSEGINWRERAERAEGEVATMKAALRGAACDDEGEGR